MPIEITEANFKELILDSDKPAVIDFWAEWCGPCRMLTPIIKDLAEEFDGKAIIGKLDVDSNPGISNEYGIRNIPTILFFKNGEVADKQVGVVPKQVIVQKLENLL